MKTFKRVISILLTVALLATVMGESLVVLAAAGSSGAPKVTIKVPETIYLKPGYNTFQYYIDGAAEGETPSPERRTNGSIRFSVDNGETLEGDVTLTYNGAEEIQFSTPNQTSTRYSIGINYGYMASAASGYIKWTFTYHIGGVEYKSTAGTYVYSPLLTQIGCDYTFYHDAGFQPVGFGWDWKSLTHSIGAYAFVTGIHETEGGSYESGFTGISGKTMSPLVEGWSDVNVPSSAKDAALNASYFPSVSGHKGGIADYGYISKGDKDHGITIDKGSGSIFGTIYVDKSRYYSDSGISLNKIPNFYGGLMIHRSWDNNDLHDVEYFKTSNNTLQFASNIDFGEDVGSGDDGKALGLYPPIGNIPLNDTNYELVASIETRYAGKWTAISVDSGVGRLNLKFGLKIDMVDKGTLRDTINEAISENYQQGSYTAESWTTYVDALTAAIQTLGNPALKDRKGNNFGDAVTNLNNAIAGLQHSSGTYTIIHRLPADNGFTYVYGGMTYTASNGYLEIPEIKDYPGGTTLTLTPITGNQADQAAGREAFHGYTYVEDSSHPGSVVIRNAVGAQSATFTYKAKTNTLKFTYSLEHEGYVKNAGDLNWTINYGEKYNGTTHHYEVARPVVDGWRFLSWKDDSGAPFSINNTPYCLLDGETLVISSTFTPIFSGRGHGSATDPFVIMDEDDLKNINTVPFDTSGYYFRQGANIELANPSPVLEFNGDYNGNGYSIKLLADAIVYGDRQTVAGEEAAYGNIFGRLEGANVHDLDFIIDGTLQAGDYDVPNYAGIFGNLIGSTVDKVHVEFNGTGSIMAGLGASLGYTGIVVASADSDSTISNSSVIIDGGHITNIGNEDMQNGFAGVVDGTLYNTWTFMKHTPTDYLDENTYSGNSVSNNTMWLNPGGEATLSALPDGQFIFRAVPTGEKAAKYAEQETPENVVEVSSVYMPAKTLDGADYGIFFTNQVIISSGGHGTVNPSGVVNKAEGETLYNITATPDEGYHFVRWDTGTTDGTIYPNTETAAIDFTMGQKGGNITAIFDVNTYTIRYDANAGSAIVDVPSPMVCEYGTHYQIAPKASRTGCQFMYWCTTADPEDGGTRYYPYADVYNLRTTNGDIILYAIWDTTTYAVTFFENGGTQFDQGDWQAIGYGIEKDVPYTTRTGYKFRAWYDNEACSTLGGGNAYPFGVKLKVTRNMSLWAGWDPITYTVRYHGNADNGLVEESIPADQVVPYNADPEAIKFIVAGENPVPERTGYEFKEWNTGVNGNKKSYQAGEEVMTNLSNEENTEINLYAQWLPNQYTVTWDYNGGTIGTATNETSIVTFGAYYVLPATQPVLDGYVFEGWYDDPVYRENQITAATAVNITDDVTYYAHWTNAHYTVHFNGNGGQVPDGGTPMYDIVVECNSSFILPANTFVRDGYRFQGWSATQGGALAYTDKATVFANLTGTDGATVNLYAVWKAMQYTLKYEKNAPDGATVKGTMSPTPVLMNATVTLRKNAFTCAGYEFIGWAETEAEADNLIVKYRDEASYTRTVAANNSIYAVWAKLTTVTWDLGGGIYHNPSGDWNFLYHTDPDTGEITDPNPYAITTTVRYGNYYSDGLGDGIYGAPGSHDTVYGDDEMPDLSSITKSRCQWVGWFTPVDGTYVEVTDNGTRLLLNEDTTVEARWQASGYLNTTYYRWDYLQRPDGTWPDDSELTGSNKHAISANVGDTVTIDPDYLDLIVGYTFDATNTNNVLTGVVRDVEAGEEPLVLKCYYKINTYKLRFDKNDASATGEMADMEFLFNESKDLPAPGFSKADPSVIVKGWSTSPDSGIVNYAPAGRYVMTGSDPITIDANGDQVVILYAVWSEHRYRVTFNTGTNNEGGFFSDGTQSKYVELEYNDVIPYPNADAGDFAREGYTFDYWYLQNGDPSERYEVLQMPGEDISLWAHWTRCDYVVTFYGNGAVNAETEPMATQAIPFGEGAILNANTYRKVGYNFDSWNTAADGSGTPYDNGGYIVMNSTSGIDLYAQWAPISYTIHFDGNGADGGTPVPDMVCYYDSAYALNLNTFEKEGGTFAGWSDVQNDGAAKYIDGEEIINFTSADNGTVTLYAIWSTMSFSIIFDGNGNTSGTVPASRPIAYGGLTYLPTPSEPLVKDTVGEYRDCIGWCTTADGKGETYSYGAPYTMKTSGNVTLYALWSANYYALDQEVKLVRYYLGIDKDPDALSESVTTAPGMLPASAIVDPGYAEGGSVAEDLGSYGFYSVDNYDTTALSEALTTASSASYRKMPNTVQGQQTVDDLLASLQNALNQVELLPADTDAPINCASHSLSWQDPNTEERYPICEMGNQHTYNSIVNLCDELVNDIGSNYTADSMEALRSAVFGDNSGVEGIVNTVRDESIKLPGQAYLDNYTQEIARCYHTIPELRAADYTELENVIEIYLPQRDGVSYAQRFNYYDETSAVELSNYYNNEIDRNLKIVNQGIIDNVYIPTLKQYVDNLSPISADYTEIYRLIQYIPWGTEGYEDMLPAQSVEGADYALWTEWVNMFAGDIYSNLDLEYLEPRYTAGSLETLEAVINNIDWGLDIFSQNDITGENNSDSYYYMLVMSISDLTERVYTVSFMTNDPDNPDDTVFATMRARYLGTVEDPGTPEAGEYMFDRWIAEDGSDFSFETPITEDLIVYAEWVESNPEEIDIVKFDDNSTAVIDKERKYIYGLPQNLDETTLFNRYIRSEGYSRLMLNGIVGTGSTVDLINKATGQIIATYTIIVFGDVTGNGSADSEDLIQMKSVSAGIQFFSDAQNFAGDFNRDGKFASDDMLQMKTVAAQINSIDPVTGAIVPINA